MQSRAARVSDILTSQEVNEIADAPPGVTAKAVMAASQPQTTAKEESLSAPVVTKEPKLSFATISRDGKVKIESTDDFRQISG